MRSQNIKTNLIKKVSCLDELIALIRKSYILSLSWKQNYCFLLVTYLGYYFTSYKSKVTSHRFIRFWILYPVWVRVCYNKLIAKSIIDYPILVSIKQVSIKMQSSSIMFIQEVCYLLSKLDYSKFYIRIQANHQIHQISNQLLVLLIETKITLLIIRFKYIIQWQ